MSSVCKIEDGRLVLPADIAKDWEKEGYRHALVVQTWDGYRLEPIPEDLATQLQADEGLGEYAEIIKAMTKPETPSR